MNYLDPSEYENYGLETTTAASWVGAASSLIDSIAGDPRWRFQLSPSAYGWSQAATA